MRRRSRKRFTIKEKGTIRKLILVNNYKRMVENSTQKNKYEKMAATKTMTCVKSMETQYLHSLKIKKVGLAAVVLSGLLKKSGVKSLVELGNEMLL